MNNTDPFFRGYDNAYPDYYREREWEREFDKFSKTGSMPNLEFVRLMHDHMGNFDNTAIDRVNCPELQQADNDYAVGLLVDKVAHSRYKSDTLIFIVEDDAQDGADHVDAHRSTTYVVGPYVRQNAVVTQRYTTVNLLRTIEDILGLQHLSIYTATQPPMTDVFDLSQSEWTFDAVPSLFLYNTCLPIPKHTTKPSSFPKPTHNAAYWAEKTAEFDFSKEDNLSNPEKFDRIIWQGLKGNVPYPAGRNGADLRQHRRHILQSAGAANQLEPSSHKKRPRPDFSLATMVRVSGATVQRDIGLSPLWQHGITDNGAEVVTAGDELSKSSSSGAKRIEGF